VNSAGDNGEFRREPPWSFSSLPHRRPDRFTELVREPDDRGRCPMVPAATTGPAGRQGEDGDAVEQLTGLC
jgi:hypothetical protein